MNPKFYGFSILGLEETETKKSSNWMLILKILLVSLIFISLLAVTVFLTSKKTCRLDAESMNLKWEYTNNRCIYILPDGIRVKPENYQVVVFSNPVDTDMGE